MQSYLAGKQMNFLVSSGLKEMEKKEGHQEGTNLQWSTWLGEVPSDRPGGRCDPKAILGPENTSSPTISLQLCGCFRRKANNLG